MDVWWQRYAQSYNSFKQLATVHASTTNEAKTRLLGSGAIAALYPPAIAPTTSNGSVPSATVAGSGSSGD